MRTTQTPIRVHSIRASRPKPGLAAQHMAGVHLVAAMCSGRLRGAEIGRTEVFLEPGVLSQREEFSADAKTAGMLPVSS